MLEGITESQSSQRPVSLLLRLASRLLLLRRYSKTTESGTCLASLVSRGHNSSTQQQPTIALPHPMQPSLSVEADQLTQHSNRGRSPLREVPRHRASSRCHPWEAFGGSRSPSHHSGGSCRRRCRREPEWTRRRRHSPSPSSGSSLKGSFDGRVARRAERRLEEYHQQLEELSH